MCSYVTWLPLQKYIFSPIIHECWTQYILKRPALWQVQALYTVQFYCLKPYPIAIPLTDTDWHTPSNRVRSSLHKTSLQQLWLDFLPINLCSEISPVLGEQGSFSLACREVYKPSLKNLPSPELPHQRMLVEIREPDQRQIHHRSTCCWRIRWFSYFPCLYCKAVFSRKGAKQTHHSRLLRPVAACWHVPLCQSQWCSWPHWTWSPQRFQRDRKSVV